MATTAIVTALIVATAALTAALNVPTVSFEEGYTPLFGDKNIIQSAGGRAVKILLNKYSGSGFISSDIYYHGLFSASIKLPSDYTAGVVVAFYMSNGDIFEKNHDELDFEFLGNVKGKEWRVQTNIYGNGSTSRGREERYQLPFDPTSEPHRYSILWSKTKIIFYIDETPIREVVRSEAMGGDFPSKPMSIYATIWDGSTWATSGGKYKVDYRYEPFVTEFKELVLHGCRMDPIQQLPASEQCGEFESQTDAADYSSLSPEKRKAMVLFRQRHMTYSCCYDEQRYPIPLPECDVMESERSRYWKSGDVKVQPEMILRRHRGKKRGRARSRGVEADGQAVA
ncbi:probable xyloglucan endotransglucosylase/hydrolase protein 30 [Phalaenopsis equestris]|uniref:probable xyloglucan endotransglucosylase/hydrolase protein 30 n=1 Tax=Phalaenopsis equestris TaxID=78828 RepID=UPI0009E5D4DD|nr:probable xyloglucan endotransglucosylase/hydrolase protein 30 [Phalaenopsis equestris]